jgi:hypothetical protein
VYRPHSPGCEVKVSATGRSSFQRSPKEHGAPECDLETSTMRRPRPTTAVKPWKKMPLKAKLIDTVLPLQYFVLYRERCASIRKTIDKCFIGKYWLF